MCSIDIDVDIVLDRWNVIDQRAEFAGQSELTASVVWE